MNPEEALNILNQMRLQASATGKDHDIARSAIEVLKAYLAATQIKTAGEVYSQTEIAR